MENKIYNELLKKVDKLEHNLEIHQERERELLQLLGIERKYRYFYSRYITLSDCYSLIPFDNFDLAINGKLFYRACTKEYFHKVMRNSVYGLGIFNDGIPHITDVRISLKESLVDLIIEENDNHVMY